LSLVLSSDPAVQAAYDVLTEESGFTFIRLLGELIGNEGVPFLAGWRYTETGMEKRSAWEETWRLQRIEEEGHLEIELERLGLKNIPVPEKYSIKDFQSQYWSLRGKLDVSRERFITVPGGSNDDDPTLLVGWAGWNHLQVAQALAALYQRRKNEDGWSHDRLVPILAGISEKVPWLLQWHNEPSEAFNGMRLGQFFKDFVGAEAHGLGVSLDDLRRWIPPSTPRRTTLDPEEVYNALLAWVPSEENEEDDEESDLPEGPTASDLATEVGAKKTLVERAIRKLESDGRIEKLPGRPARFVALGDEA